MDPTATHPIDGAPAHSPTMKDTPAHPYAIDGDALILIRPDNHIGLTAGSRR